VLEEIEKEKIMIAKAYNKHVVEKSFQVGDVRVSARVKLWVTCSGSDSGEALGNTLVYDSGK
jgi:hypothetical protein